MAYSDFITQVEAGKVDCAIRGNDRIEYVLKPETPPSATEPENGVSTSTNQVFTTTLVAIDFRSAYGMSNELSRVAFEKTQQQDYLSSFNNLRRPVSSKVADEINREVKEIVDRAHHIALSILNQNRDLLKKWLKVSYSRKF